MIALNTFRLMIIAILISVFCMTPCLIMAPAYAQSPGPTVVSLSFIGQYPQTQGYTGEVISGLVIDEDGKPVTGATVTLWQNGSLWALNSGLAYNGGDVNPRTSGISGDNGGSFLYGLAAPGSYVVTAEKDGYSGSANVTVDNITISSYSGEDFNRIIKPVNITLQGYHVPALSQEQLSFTGGIAGTVKTVQEYWINDANVSLWRDGVLVVLPENPQSTHTRDFQGRQVNFLFEHLAPGQYEVVAISRGDYYDNATVNVTDQIENVDIRSFAFGMVAPELLPVALPLVSMVLAALVILRSKKDRR